MFRRNLRFDDGGGKLCMKQYERLLTSHRIPGNGTDTLKTWDAAVSNESEHIIVTSNYYVRKYGITAVQQCGSAVCIALRRFVPDRFNA